MQSKRMDEPGTRRTFLLVLAPGEEAFAAIRQFAVENEIRSGYLMAIGALQSATIAFYDRSSKEYQQIPVSEQVEVLSLMGNISRKNGDVVLHAHVLLGKSDGSTMGGHLLEAVVWPTLEVYLVENAAEANRFADETTGLTLINLQS